MPGAAAALPGRLHPQQRINPSPARSFRSPSCHFQVRPGRPARSRAAARGQGLLGQGLPIGDGWRPRAQLLPAASARLRRFAAEQPSSFPVTALSAAAGERAPSPHAFDGGRFVRPSLPCWRWPCPGVEPGDGALRSMLPRARQKPCPAPSPPGALRARRRGRSPCGPPTRDHRRPLRWRWLVPPPPPLAWHCRGTPSGRRNRPGTSRAGQWRGGCRRVILSNWRPEVSSS